MWKISSIRRNVSADDGLPLVEGNGTWNTPAINGAKPSRLDDLAAGQRQRAKSSTMERAGGIQEIRASGGPAGELHRAFDGFGAVIGEEHARVRLDRRSYQAFGQADLYGLYRSPYRTYGESGALGLRWRRPPPGESGRWN